MRFTSSAAPTLTPLGVRLMNLSRSKLTRLEPPVGGRDTAHTLLRGVLVREAVRSAWASLESGPSELTDWRAPTALGLDTLTEEDEDESEDQQAAEAAWLDDVLSTVDEDTSVDTDESAWAETTVSRPEAFDDDFDYDDDAIQAFTLPTMSSAMDIEEADALVAHALAADAEDADADVTVVEVAAVDYDDDYEEYSDYEDMATSWIELDSSSQDDEFEDKLHIEHSASYTHFDSEDTASDSTPSLTASTTSDVSVESPEEEQESLLTPPLSDVLTSAPAIAAAEPETNSLLQTIPRLHRPAFSRAQPFAKNHPVVELDVYELDPCDGDTCPDLVDSGGRRYAHCSGDDCACDDTCDAGTCDSDDEDEDDCPCRTPPLMSCEQLEEVASGKAFSIWSDDSEVVNLNFDAITI